MRGNAIYLVFASIHLVFVKFIYNLWLYVCEPLPDVKTQCISPVNCLSLFHINRATIFSCVLAAGDRT